MNKSKLFLTAWAIYRQNDISFSQSLKLAWQRHKVVKDLRDSLCLIEFTKKDGTPRMLFGTLDPKVTNYTPTGNSKKRNPLQVSFFSTELNAFRSFLLPNLTTFTRAF